MIGNVKPDEKVPTIVNSRMPYQQFQQLCITILTYVYTHGT